jgi:hypothetical protein
LRGVRSEINKEKALGVETRPDSQVFFLFRIKLKTRFLEEGGFLGYIIDIS